MGDNSEMCGTGDKSETFNNTVGSSVKKTDISKLMIPVVVRNKDGKSHRIESVPASMWSRE